MQPVRSQVTCHVISWAWRGIAWRRRCQLTVPPGCARLYGTVHDCIDRTGYDVRLAVSCRCVCPAWQDREPLHLQTPHFIIDTQRTPRAPALENFITQGPAMTSLWNAHPPGHMPTSCNTHYFLHARIERTDHRQRHSGSGLDVRMSQCNAMQCTAGPARWWKQTVSVEGTTRRKCAETTNINCGVTAVWSSCLHRNLDNISPRRSSMPTSRERTHKPCVYGSASCLDARSRSCGVPAIRGAQLKTV